MSDDEGRRAMIAALEAFASSEPNEEDEDGDWSEGWSYYIGCHSCGTAIGGDSFDKIWDGEDAARMAYEYGWRIHQGQPLCEVCQQRP